MSTFVKALDDALFGCAIPGTGILAFAFPGAGTKRLELRNLLLCRHLAISAYLACLSPIAGILLQPVGLTVSP